MYRHMRLLLIFNYFLCVVIAFERQLRPADSGLSLRRDEAEDPQQPCSLPTCGAAADAASSERHLEPRVLSAPDPRKYPEDTYWFGPEHYGGSVDAFFRGEVAKRVLHKQDIVPHSKEPVDFYTVHFGDSRETIVMTGLTGGVGIVVVSKAAAWMAHLYENTGLNHQLAFQIGLHRLKYGALRDQTKDGLLSLSNDVFAPEQRPVAVLFAPSKWTRVGSLPHPLLTSVKGVIREVLGIETETVGYTPAQDGGIERWTDPSCTVKEGKVMAQYQPSHAGRFGMRSSARARIWFEGNTWTKSRKWRASAGQFAKKEADPNSLRI